MGHREEVSRKAINEIKGDQGDGLLRTPDMVCRALYSPLRGKLMSGCKLPVVKVQYTHSLTKSERNSRQTDDAGVHATRNMRESKSES